MTAVPAIKTCWLVAPAVKSIVVGVDEREKSATGVIVLFELQPMERRAMKLRVKSSRMELKKHGLEFCSGC